MTRQMVDKRQCRKVNRQAFCNALEEWRQANPPVDDGKEGKENDVLAGQPLASPGSQQRRLRAIVRKRPLFSYESERGEFDVVSVRGAGSVVVHNCCMQPDLKRMFVKHTSFASIGDAFDETVKTPEVCARGVHPLLANVLGGGCSTLFMYGQTGSGKTHTMKGIEEYASEVLLPRTEAEAAANHAAVVAEGAAAADDDGVDGEGPPPLGHLSFFEIAGTRCIELLGDRHGRELALKQDADGRVQPVGATRAPVRSAEGLLELIAIAKSRRATESTGANNVSSRSHAVCQLTLRALPLGAPAANVRRRRGGKASAPMLTLVDCAGTERKEDSMWHDADRRKEGAEINQSLHALKECMRHWVMVQDGRQAHIPFRESALTRVLADSFMRPDTLITVVGTVSPSASDTEHTLTTLKTVAAVTGNESMIKEVKRDVKAIVEAPALHTIPPKMWAEDRLRAWLRDTITGRGEALLNVLPHMPAKGVDGKGIMRMTVIQFRQLWGLPEDLAQALFHELRVATKSADAAKESKRRGDRAAGQRRRAGQL